MYTSGIKRTIRGCYVKLYTNKLDNLKEISKPERNIQTTKTES